MNDQYNSPIIDQTARLARTDAGQEIRWAIDRAVTDYANATGGQLHERPIRRGAASTMRYADPVTGIQAATIVRESAWQVRRDYVRRAREDGLSWETVGRAFGFETGVDAKYGDALAVEGYVASVDDPGIGREPVFFWDCRSCGRAIQDLGPYEAHPSDNEQGHAKDCERLAADVAAYRRKTAEWEADFEREAGQ